MTIKPFAHYPTYFRANFSPFALKYENVQHLATPIFGSDIFGISGNHYRLQLLDVKSKPWILDV